MRFHHGAMNSSGEGVLEHQAADGAPTCHIILMLCKYVVLVVGVENQNIFFFIHLHTANTFCTEMASLTWVPVPIGAI